MILNAAWIACVHMEQLSLSVLTILALLAMLVVVFDILTNTKPSSRVEAIVVDATAFVYLGWVCRGGRQHRRRAGRRRDRSVRSRGRYLGRARPHRSRRGRRRPCRRRVTDASPSQQPSSGGSYGSPSRGPPATSLSTSQPAAPSPRWRPRDAGHRRHRDRPATPRTFRASPPSRTRNRVVLGRSTTSDP